MSICSSTPPLPPLYEAAASVQFPYFSYDLRKYSQENCVDLSTLYLSSTTVFISIPSSLPVSGIICQKPVAPAGDTILLYSLSAATRYLKSSGTLFFFRIFSISGRYL